MSVWGGIGVELWFFLRLMSRKTHVTLLVFFFLFSLTKRKQTKEELMGDEMRDYCWASCCCRPSSGCCSCDYPVAEWRQRGADSYTGCPQMAVSVPSCQQGCGVAAPGTADCRDSCYSRWCCRNNHRLCDDPNVVVVAVVDLQTTTTNPSEPIVSAICGMIRLANEPECFKIKFLFSIFHWSINSNSDFNGKCKCDLIIPRGLFFKMLSCVGCVFFFWLIKKNFAIQPKKKKKNNNLELWYRKTYMARDWE